jgi:probable HAF family extracellular repeat protein
MNKVMSRSGSSSTSMTVIALSKGSATNTPRDKKVHNQKLEPTCITPVSLCRMREWKMMKTKCIRNIITVTVCWLTYSLYAQPTYRIEHIPGLANNYIVRISDAGHIVAEHYLWYQGVRVDLGGLGGNFTSVEDVNNVGQVVGRSRDSSGNMRPFLWQNGNMVSLPTLGGSDGFATAINNDGKIVGYTDNIPSRSIVNYRATHWPNPTTALDLGTVGSDSSSMAWVINNFGQAAAISRPGTGSGYGQDAFLWDAGVITPFIEDDRHFSIDGINDLGHVVGYKGQDAYVWNGVELQHPGTLGGTFSSAYGINNNGEIVGSSDIVSGDLRAFYYADGKMLLLSDLVEDMSDWEYLQIAFDINEAGKIVGVGKPRFSYRDTEVFLLTPIADPPVIVETSLNPAILWPPNGKMVEVQVSAVVEGGTGDMELEIVDIECNESHSQDDCKLLDSHSVSLRAKREGRGTDRTYTLYLKVTDEAGQISEIVSVTVLVPHDKDD